MSEDRMDRAERIRNMREGNRGTDDEPDDTGDDGSTAESADDGTPTTSDGGHQPAAESAPATETSGVPTETATDALDPADTDDASSAAQRAAASAAEVMGDDVDTGDSSMSDGPAGIAQGVTGVELPDQELLEEAMAQSSVESTEGGARATAIEEGTTQSEELVRVLEFSLGDEYYCLDIEYVEEIVKRDAVTRVPNTPDFVDGVVDLRGQITTILEPKEMMDIETEGSQNLIVVFDPDQFEDQGAVGWVVDEVRQVVPITEGEVNSPPVDAEYINGVIDREEYDQFVIWVEPDDALAQATGGEAE